LNCEKLENVFSGQEATGEIVKNFLTILLSHIGNITEYGHDFIMDLAKSLAQTSFKIYINGTSNLPKPIFIDFQFQKIHSQASHNSTNHFDKNCIGSKDKPQNAVHRDFLIQNISIKASELKHINSKILYEQCKSLSKQHKIELEEMEDESIEIFQAKEKELKDIFKKKCTIWCPSDDSQCLEFQKDYDDEIDKIHRRNVSKNTYSSILFFLFGFFCEMFIITLVFHTTILNLIYDISRNLLVTFVTLKVLGIEIINMIEKEVEKQAGLDLQTSRKQFIFFVELAIGQVLDFYYKYLKPIIPFSPWLIVLFIPLVAIIIKYSCCRR